MTVLWFILGIALIFGIARYNESNKLFWTLLFAFVMGFAGTKMLLEARQCNEQSSGNLAQVYSTHVPAIINASVYYTASNLSQAGTVVTAQQHVSQSLTPALSETNTTQSEVFERTRDQPLFTLTKPPELCFQKDFSILHDTG